MKQARVHQGGFRAVGKALTEPYRKGRIHRKEEDKGACGCCTGKHE